MALLVYFLFFLVLLMLIRFVRAQGKKPNQPPSPFKLPIIGNLHQLGSLPHRSLRVLSVKHGPLMLLHLGNIPTLVVSSAEMAHEILKTHDIVFANRPFSYVAQQLLYGCTDVAFANYGEYWRQVRKVCVLELLSTKRVQSFRYVWEEEVENMINEISSSCSVKAVDLTELFVSMSSGIISRVALGKKYIEGGDHGKNRFANLATELEVLLGAFCVGDYFPWLGWIDVLTRLDARLKRNSQGWDSFLDQVIDDHLSKTNGANDEHNDFVDVLLQVQKNGTCSVELTNDNIKAIILDMFTGATDTTATTLEWAMAELMKNPHVMEKAQAEVRRVVGRKSKVEESHILQMEYMKYVIKETLRLHPAVPLLVPHESATSLTLQGYHISPKTRVFINAYAIGRDPKSWDNADEFLPERFFNNPIDFKGKDFRLIPFGAGRRSCPGVSFAISNIELALANLLFWFDWEMPGGTTNDDLDMSEASGLTVHKKIPLHLVPMHHFS